MLVGRDAEAARLAEALAADRPVVVTGEAGVGKTSLLRAVAAASGRVVREGGALSTLAWLDYLAVERALGHPPASSDAAAVAAEVEREVGPGVLVLDDLQWAASATMETVELLAGRIGLLAGVRRGDAAADAAVDRLAGAGFAVVELAGLGAKDAEALLHELRPDLGRAATARLVSRTGGNPLLLRELALTGEPSPSLRRAIAARLRRLDDVGREAFGVLALAGRPVSVDGLGPTGAKALLAADLAIETDDGRIEIRHALLGEVAVDELAEDERRRLHSIIARHVDDDGEAARHYRLAGERRAAYDAARRAADQTRRPGERARHLAIAAACADGPEADRLRVEAALALEDAHDWPALRAVLDELRSGDETVRATAALIRARAAWRAGDPDGLRSAIDEGLALVEGSGSEVEVALRVEQSRIPIFVDGDPVEAVRSTSAALELARAAGVDVARAEYLHGTALYLSQNAAGGSFLESAVAAARDAGDVGTEMVAGNNLVAFLESMGDQAVARTVAEQLADRAAQLGLAVWERSFRSALANLEFHAGNYPAVLAAGDELLDLPLEARTREMLLEQTCLSLVDLGRIDEALRRIAAVPDRPGDWTWHRQVLWVRAEAALWGGRPQEALSLAEEILTGPEGDLNIVFAHVTRAWALLDLDRNPGPPLTADYPPVLAAVPDEVLGICLLHGGGAPEAAEAFDRAAQRWAPYHRRGEVRCLWAAGEAARRAGAPDAVDRLLAAEARAQSLEMLPMVGRIHRSLRAAGVRRAAPRTRDRRSLLTGREQQVLDLVASGLTNAEIAGRLGVSRHTVVTQIGSASAKLGATGRRHAATLAARAEAL